MYSLQDANENVVGMVDEYGDVYVQYTLDPYGTIRVSEHNTTPHAVSRIGHQGLFADRLGGDPTLKDLEPGELILYYNRNRTYAPGIGRFLQKDPHGLAGSIPTDTARNRLLDSVDGWVLDLTVHYVDGLNTHVAYASSPLLHTDPHGMFLGSPLEVLQAMNLRGNATNAQVSAVGIGGGLNLLVNRLLMSYVALGGSTTAGVIAYGGQQFMLFAENAANSSFTGSWGGGYNGGGGPIVAGGFPDEPFPGDIDAIIDYINFHGRAPTGWESHKYKNTSDPLLPRFDGFGNRITYTTYDVAPTIKGVNRGKERLVIGTDGSVWHTLDHYASWLKIR